MSAWSPTDTGFEWLKIITADTEIENWNFVYWILTDSKGNLDNPQKSIQYDSFQRKASVSIFVDRVVVYIQSEQFEVFLRIQISYIYIINNKKRMGSS